MNLIVNARDAFESSGKIVLKTSNIKVDETFIDQQKMDVLPGAYVMLAVSDNGTGIEADLLDRIFDPFFTTKAVGKGSGLGLSMVQGFMKQSGGTIRVASETGTGTNFELYFPALAETAVATDETVVGIPSASILTEHQVRILLVEDRAEVMLVLQKILEASKLQVVTAESGDQAADIFHSKGPFDLIVTDIVMPGVLQGPTLADKIRLTNPDMRFIFLSGYASEASVYVSGIRPDDIRLMKPVSRIDLLSAVERSLSSLSKKT